MTTRANYKEYDTVSQTGAGSSSAIVLDHLPSNGKLTVTCDATGTVNYDIEFTAVDPDSPIWLQHPQGNGQTADYGTTIEWPCQAVRVTVNSGSGSVVLYVTEGPDK